MKKQVKNHPFKSLFSNIYRAMTFKEVVETILEEEEKKHAVDYSPVENIGGAQANNMYNTKNNALIKNAIYIRKIDEIPIVMRK